MLKLCRIADQYLWNAYHRQHDGSSIFIFPEHHKKMRVSEQEARFAFVEALCRTRSFRYSIETPTSKTYSFTGKKELAAQTDLTVYDVADYSRICNIEFKAKGFSLASKNLLSISKDVQKLLREPVHGLWFHLLESIDKTTISKLLTVLAECISQARRSIYDIDSPKITVHICVLKQGFSMQKEFQHDTSLKLYPQIDFLLSNLSSDNSKYLNGWCLHRHENNITPQFQF
ncbi:MAG: hypothetical protein ACTFAL_14095 [Candidatus Electronema sp. V4]|uniref:hypothetical protein n=1 Tax=Candidatus Electronema sp. V4 TaxID=3454756 RepID=UPI0040557649